MNRWTAPGTDPDQLAIDRYRYLLRTAPPEAIEAAHQEAFAQLTPDQRRRVLEGLAAQVDPAELRGVDDSPDRLARLATRAELRRPGTMESTLGGRGGGWFGGGGGGGSFFSMLAGAFVGTSIAQMLVPGDAFAGGPGAGDGGWGDAGPGGDARDGGRVQGGDWGGDGDAGGWGDGGGFDGGGFDIGF